MVLARVRVSVRLGVGVRVGARVGVRARVMVRGRVRVRGRGRGRVRVSRVDQQECRSNHLDTDTSKDHLVEVTTQT